MTNRTHDTVTDALMLVGGSVVGAGLALLFAPQSGTKCRRDLARLGRSVSKKSERIFHDFTDGVSEFAGTVGGKTGGILHKW